MNNTERVEAMRMQLWIRVEAAVASDPNTTRSNAPGDWADEALEKFDRTFDTKKESDVEQ